MNRPKKKVMLMWLKQRCRKPKMEGLATADDSASRIYWMCQHAKKKYGSAYIIEATSANEARQYIYQFQKLRKEDERFNPNVVMSLCSDRVVAIGARSILALAGASEAILRWDDRIRQYGKVPGHMTNALHTVNLQNINLQTIFSERLFK